MREAPVVLLGMPVVMDLLAYFILRTLEVLLLLRREVSTVCSLVRLFPVLNRVLSVLEVGGLTSAELAVLDPVANAVLLVLLTLVYVVFPTVALLTAARAGVESRGRLAARSRSGGLGRCRSLVGGLGGGRADKHHDSHSQNCKQNGDSRCHGDLNLIP